MVHAPRANGWENRQMSATSTLTNMSSEMRAKAFAYLEEKGFERPSYARVNLYITREAQRDGDPAVTWEEAAAAIDAYAARAPLTRLPGPEKNFVFELEDGTNVWGKSDYVSPKAWQAFISGQASLYDVEAKFELVPGSVKKPSFWDKLAGSPVQAKYKVTLRGDKAHVERVVDAYHERKYAKDNEGE